MKIGISIIILLTLFTTGLYANGLQGKLETSDDSKLKSPAVAVGLALGATIVPIAVGYSLDFDQTWWLAASGLTLGPSAGHFYAQQWGRGLWTTGLRAGLLTFGVGITTLTLGESLFGGSSWGGPILGITSLLAAFGLAIYDLGTTEESVEKYNASRKGYGRLNIMPYRDAANKGYGLSFVYNF